VPFCKEKISILMLKISDDLFLLYSYIYNIYHTLFLTKNVYLIKPISLLQLSHASNNTTSREVVLLEACESCKREIGLIK